MQGKHWRKCRRLAYLCVTGAVGTWPTGAIEVFLVLTPYSSGSGYKGALLGIVNIGLDR